MAAMKFGQVSEWHNQEHARYQAATENKLKRKRIIPANGAPGDYHLPGGDYLKIMEYARAMDRDDAIMPSILTRAEINTIQDGFGLDFDTGEKGFDQELLGGWCEWAEDPALCDVSQELAFSEMESLLLRQSWVDGDHWAYLTDDDNIQIFEGDRPRSPFSVGDRYIVNGVELDENRRAVAVHLTKAILGLTQQYRLSGDDLYQVPIRDDDGLRRMLQVYTSPKRATLTRGMSVYQNLFEFGTMHDDTQFAALLKQQLQNAVIFTEDMKEGDNGPATNFGPKDEEAIVQDGSEVENIQGMGPATVVRNRNGRALKPSRNSAPGPDYEAHIKMILTIMGVNLGMPLVLCLMDAKETNFSGWRGAFDQAKMGFIRNQKRLISRFHDPVLKWHLSRRAEKDTRFAVMMTKLVNKAKAAGRQWYKWHRPSWPYVNPMEDAGASLIAVANYLEAPSTNMSKNGSDYEREMTRGMNDRDFAMRAAIDKANAINADFPDLMPKPTWQDYYTPLAPKHVTMTISEPRMVDEPPPVKTAPAGGKA